MYKKFEWTKIETDLLKQPGVLKLRERYGFKGFYVYILMRMELAKMGENSYMPMEQLLGCGDGILKHRSETLFIINETGLFVVDEYHNVYLAPHVNIPSSPACKPACGAASGAACKPASDTISKIEAKEKKEKKGGERGKCAPTPNDKIWYALAKQGILDQQEGSNWRYLVTRRLSEHDQQLVQRNWKRTFSAFIDDVVEWAYANTIRSLYDAQRKFKLFLTPDTKSCVYLLDTLEGLNKARIKAINLNCSELGIQLPEIQDEKSVMEALCSVPENDVISNLKTIAKKTVWTPRRKN